MPAHELEQNFFSNGLFIIKCTRYRYTHMLHQNLFQFQDTIP